MRSPFRVRVPELFADIVRYRAFTECTETTQRGRTPIGVQSIHPRLLLELRGEQTSVLGIRRTDRHVHSGMGTVVADQRKAHVREVSARVRTSQRRVPAWMRKNITPPTGTSSQAENHEVARIVREMEQDANSLQISTPAVELSIRGAYHVEDGLRSNQAPPLLDGVGTVPAAPSPTGVGRNSETGRS